MKNWNYFKLNLNFLNLFLIFCFNLLQSKIRRIIINCFFLMSFIEKYYFCHHFYYQIIDFYNSNYIIPKLFSNSAHLIINICFYPLQNKFQKNFLNFFIPLVFLLIYHLYLIKNSFIYFPKFRINFLFLLIQEHFLIYLTNFGI